MKQRASNGKVLLFKDQLNVPKFEILSVVSLNNSIWISNWAWYVTVISYLLEIDSLWTPKHVPHTVFIDMSLQITFYIYVPGRCVLCLKNTSTLKTLLLSNNYIIHFPELCHWSLGHLSLVLSTRFIGMLSNFICQNP